MENGGLTCRSGSYWRMGFYRERQRHVDGAEHPRFLLVAVHEVDLKVYAQHLRMSELKTIAEATGAELIALPRGGGTRPLWSVSRILQRSFSSPDDGSDLLLPERASDGAALVAVDDLDLPDIGRVRK
jgi:hypothetical protein